MSKRDDTVSLRHMLDHAREAYVMARRYSRRELESNRMPQLALTRLVEIIGEAASRVSHETRSQYPRKFPGPTLSA